MDYPRLASADDVLEFAMTVKRKAASTYLSVIPDFKDRELAQVAAQRSAISTDFEMAALGRVSAALTGPLERVAGERNLTPATTAALAKIAEDARYFQNVSAMRIYRPNGAALYPAGAPTAREQVTRALQSDTLLSIENGDTITAYSPYFTATEKLYVIAIDFSAALQAGALERARAAHHERASDYRRRPDLALAYDASDRALRTPPSRAHRRQRVSCEVTRRRHSAWCAPHRGRRCVRRDDDGPAVSPRPLDRGKSCRTRSRRRHASSSAAAPQRSRPRSTRR